MPSPTPIAKQDGVTVAERYLSRLCAKSFLSLWSYPGVYRDQGVAGDGDGKEICDLLVVFGNDVIIFSDKDCTFPTSEKLDVDWVRWFRRAVQRSADQVWGAERWIRNYPSRIFVDRRCTQHLPVPLPNAASIRVHRIVIAHDAARRCRELLGGSGSLVIFPALEGNAHVSGPVVLPGCEGDMYEQWAKAFKEPVNYAMSVLPFAIGDLDRRRGFVHVFDDTGLAIVMTELDTIADFVHYLVERERYIRSDRLLMASGEDDLLAHYIQEINGYSFRSFHIPEDAETKVIIPEGEWSALQCSAPWLARKRADRVSYIWDEIIERFNVGILDGTSAAYPFADFSRQELAVRALAGEPRLHRRILATALGEFLQKQDCRAILARVVKPIRSGRPYYIFLSVRPEADEAYDDYRKRRHCIAFAYLIEGKRKFDAEEVVVIATESPGWTKWATEDAQYRGHEPLTEAEIKSVRPYVEDQGVLKRLGQEIGGRALEYPRATDQSVPCASPIGRASRTGRNELCPCGSGRKFKKCCLKPGVDRS
jgi:SEC-C motif